MAQNPSANNEIQSPESRELFEIRNDVGLAYEPTDPLKSSQPREEVGQTIVDAANQPSYLDELAASVEAESMTPEQKLILIGTNIQAMRRNAIREGSINAASVTFSKIATGPDGYAEAA